MAQYHYFLGRSDIRSKDPVERAIALHKENGVSYRNAAATCGVSVGAIQRALKAVEENREIGQIGHPRLLSTEQQQNFDQSLEASLRPNKRVKYEDARQVVTIFQNSLLILPTF